MIKNENRIGRCVVHIGSEKTGTTSLQRFCAGNRALLRSQGFCYSRSLAYENEHLHRKLSDLGCARKDHDHSELVEAFRQECSKVAATGAHTVVLSSEFLHSRLRNPSDVARVRDFLNPFFEKVQVVYYARRQDMLLVSMHSTGVRGGFTTSGSALAIYEHKGHHYFDHLGVCDLWAGQFGRDNLICRIYERDKLSNGDVVDDFSTVVGFPVGKHRARPATNESLSLETMWALLLVNASRHRDNKELRRKLMAMGKKRNGVRVPMLARADAQAFYSRFQASNREFFAKYVDKALATEFSGDFSGFPDVVPHMSAEEIQAFVFG